MKKAVLITGAGSGIGAATALEFSKNGYFVFLLGRDKTKLETIGSQCSHGASLLKCDLTVEADLQKAIKHLHERPDVVLEVLVNNAGIFSKKSSLEIEPNDWLEMFNTNLFSAAKLTQGLLPLMLKNKKGSIVNVSSTLGLKPSAGTAIYSASKAAMNSWTQGLALDLAGTGIRANAVCPGIVDTPIHSFHALPEEQKSKALESMRNLQPMNRIGTPVDIAKAIYFLGSDESSWTTGSLLSVDGGISIT